MSAISTNFPSALSTVAGQRDSFPITSRKASNYHGLSISIPTDPVLTPLELNLGTPFIGNDLIRSYIWSPTSKRFSTLWSASRSRNSEAEPLLSNTNRSEDEDDDAQYITLDYDNHFYNLPSHLFHSFKDCSETEIYPSLSLSFSCNALGDEEHGQAAAEFHDELTRIALDLDDSKFYDPDCLRGIETDLLAVPPVELFQEVLLKSLKKRAFSDLHPVLAPENNSSEESDDDDDEFFDADEEPVSRKTSGSSIQPKPIDVSAVDRKVIAPFEEPKPETCRRKSSKLHRLLSRRRLCL